MAPSASLLRVQGAVLLMTTALSGANGSNVKTNFTSFGIGTISRTLTLTTLLIPNWKTT